MSSTRLHSKPQGVTVDRTACFLLSHSWHSSNRSNNNGCCCHSVAQSCLTLFDRMDCSTPGFPVLHYLPELAQTHVHWVGDAIQPSHPLWSPSPPAFNLSHYQGLFQWVGWLFPSGGQSIGASASASVLPVTIQGWFPLSLTGLISLLSKGLSGILFSTKVWKHQFIQWTIRTYFL